MTVKNDEFEAVRVQLLKLMTASKAVIDSKNTDNQYLKEKALIELQREYVKSIVLVKSKKITPQIPALLRPIGDNTIAFNETLSVGLVEV